MNYTQQLDAFWARYVVMNAVDVISVCAAEPEFDAMLKFVMKNRLYGFADYPATWQKMIDQMNSYVTKF